MALNPLYMEDVYFYFYPSVTPSIPKNDAVQKPFYQTNFLSWNHRVTEYFAFEGIFKGLLVKPLCNEQGHPQLDQSSAQSGF